MEHKKKISLVIPVYNEEKNILNLYQQLTTLFYPLLDLYDYEFIWIDDGSKDNSWHILSELSSNDSKMKVVKLSRNFGHQAALTCGYEMAYGDAVISIDADLQDPPTVILSLIEKWQLGADIVYARRVNRNDSFLKKITAWFYYLILDALSEISIPRNVGDFRLLDKKVIYALRQFPEKSRYLRGLVAWTGFKSDFVDFNRQPRAAGNSGYSWKKMLKLGLDGITSFSTVLLKLPLYGGIFMIFTSACIFMALIICKINNPLLWISSFFYSMFGIQSLFLWGLGQYIDRLFIQQNGRPLFIISDFRNVHDSLQTSLGLIAPHLPRKNTEKFIVPISPKINEQNG